MSLLMWLFIIPFIASAIAFVLPLRGRVFKALAVLLSLIPLVILIAGGDWKGAEVTYAWIPPLSIDFRLQVDSLSLLFLYLTAIIVPISIMAIHSEKFQYPNAFYGLVLFLEGLLIGFFTARDLVLFTIFYEAMLFPLYFIITMWGGPQKERAAFKFLIYMLAGSTLMIAAILFLYFDGGNTFNLDALAKTTASAPHAAWLCAIFLLAFSVKTPLFPFHAWLPDAYCQASTSGTILLSALLSKAGIYGILRVVLKLFPNVIQLWSPWLLTLAIIGVIYGGLAAWTQKDYKRLIAYSSFSHVNFILAGVFVLDQIAQEGAILQAINHGVTIAALFLVSGWLEERLGTTAMGKVSGMAKFLPHLCWLTLFFVLSSVALPGLNNFVGEVLILLGVFKQNSWMIATLALTVILSVVYMLRWMQKVYFESPVFYQERWVDIKKREFLIAAPLIALILWIGIYPLPILKQVQPAAENITVATNLENIP